MISGRRCFHFESVPIQTCMTFIDDYQRFCVHFLYTIFCSKTADAITKHIKSFLVTINATLRINISHCHILHIEVGHMLLQLYYGLIQFAHMLRINVI